MHKGSVDSSDAGGGAVLLVVVMELFLLLLVKRRKQKSLSVTRGKSRDHVAKFIGLCNLTSSFTADIPISCARLATTPSTVLLHILSAAMLMRSRSWRCKFLSGFQRWSLCIVVHHTDCHFLPTTRCHPMDSKDEAVCDIAFL